MQKTILITGATDGIGLATAKMLIALGHNVILHGRNKAKLISLKQVLNAYDYIEADLSDIAQVYNMAEEVKSKFYTIDVLINNAGVFKSNIVKSVDNLDIRFAVNVIAPYILTKELATIMPEDARVINLSSAAQDKVNLKAFYGDLNIDDREIYGQSKLALTMWTNYLALSTKQVLVSVNPGSLLGSKMVKQAFGIEGNDIEVGARILTKASLDDEFSDASGKYYDNDHHKFDNPHPDALNAEKNKEIVKEIEKILAEKY
tara:strand:+ start:8166 stop:8945 length:780 start_codon:yes stop_codon:yes gene_type:complete